MTVIKKGPRLLDIDDCDVHSCIGHSLIDLYSSDGRWRCTCAAITTVATVTTAITVIQTFGEAAKGSFTGII